MEWNLIYTAVSKGKFINILSGKLSLIKMYFEKTSVNWKLS